MATEHPINLRGRPLETLPARFARFAAVGGLTLLVSVAMTILARRAAGALGTSLPPLALAATGLLVAAVAVAIRLGWFNWPAAEPGTRDWAVMATTSLAVLALGACLCLPTTPPVGCFLLCTPLLVGESWAWAWHVRHSLDAAGQDNPRAVRIDGAYPSSARGLPFDSELSELPEMVTQRLTRSRAADGTEELSGLLRMPFAAGQRTGSVHVAFCPPLCATPEVAVEQIEGPEAQIKTAQLLPYGARFDLKLAAEAEEATSVLLQFSARTASASPQVADSPNG